MSAEEVNPDPRTKISPSRRLAFRLMAVVFVLSGLGSVPVWRFVSPPSATEAEAMRLFSEKVQARCEFVGMNLWRSAVAGFPKSGTRVLCGISGVQYLDDVEKMSPEGLTRAVLRQWGDHLRISFDGMNLELAVVPMGERTSTFSCFKPLANPAWFQCEGNPEWGCHGLCREVHLH